MADWGGKAGGLQRLRASGRLVPDFEVFDSKTAAEEVMGRCHAHFGKEVLLAVRSSAANEDGAEQSHAGEFHSEVAVESSAVSEAFERVVETLPDTPGQAVIVQTFVDGDFSGVAFADPFDQGVLIDYLPGLCTAVVGGYDVHHVRIREGKIALKQELLKCEGSFHRSGRLESIESDARIEDARLLMIADVCMMLAKEWNLALDIEWTLKEGKLYFLQARPITKQVGASQKIRYYDSANVGESYGGIVLPLTISFAKKLYSQVYQDLLFHSGVPRSYLSKHCSTFDALVDGAYGRMYYRMEHWYNFLSMLPGYGRNKRNLEHMLLLQENNAELKVRPLWHVSLLYYPRVIWKLLNFGRSMRALEAKTKQEFSMTASWDYASMTAHEAREKLQGLFNGILRDWYLTVENDTVVMSLYAALTKRKPMDAKSPALLFHSVSTDQVNHLVALSQAVHDHTEAATALEGNDYDAFKKALNNSTELNGRWEAYFKQYGGRFANELKLETPGLQDDPEALMRMLKLYADLKPLSIQGRSSNQKLGFVERVFQRFASRRETFRLYRASLFAIVRRLVLVIAKDLKASKVIDQANDVFYLDWDELMVKHSNSTLGQEVAQRKLAYTSFEHIDPPPHFTVKNGQWPKPRVHESKAQLMQGMPASKGNVAGKALVLPTFEMPERLDFDILVTKRTDPGWTPLMALAKGMVVEHGGMLSHASIVARELGIPTVIGVKDACDQIKTGDMITVDGDSGDVFKLQDND